MDEDMGLYMVLDELNSATRGLERWQRTATKALQEMEGEGALLIRIFKKREARARPWFLAMDSLVEKFISDNKEIIGAAFLAQGIWHLKCKKEEFKTPIIWHF